MKVVYDGRIYCFQKAGGINRYFAEIIARLPKEWEPAIIGVSDLGTNAPQHVNLRTCNGPFFRPRRVSHKVRKIRWHLNFNQRTSLLHPTYYDLSDGIDLQAVRCPVVLTVYDMIYANYPDLMDGADLVVRTQREAILRADHIVCISKETERDLLERIPQATGKTSVIYLGSSFANVNGAVVHDTASRPSFLYVGGRTGYKNFALLLRAFAAAAQSCRNIRLHVAGAPLADYERWQIHFLGITHLVEAHVFPDEHALQELYRSSLALLYPSRHEGFGIPPLEAMSCGTVAVTANTTSLPEVVGDGGIMLDPTDEAQWVDCILGLAKGTVNRAELIARGFKQAGRFSWETTATQHIQLYKSFHP